MLAKLSVVLLLAVSGGAYAADSASDLPDFPSSPSVAADASAPPGHDVHRLGYNLDTPIQTLAANPTTAAIVDQNIPGLLNDSNYPIFKGMSLKAVASLSGGQITPRTLEAIAGQLKSVPVATASNYEKNF